MARRHLIIYNQEGGNFARIWTQMCPLNEVQKVDDNAVLIRMSDSGGRLLFQTRLCWINADGQINVVLMSRIYRGLGSTIIQEAGHPLRFQQKG